MKTILLYFDGLPASQRAVEVARTITEAYSGRLVLLHVRSHHLVSSTSPTPVAQSIHEAGKPILSVPEQAREEEMRQSLAIIEKGREQLEMKRIKADYLIAEGDVIEEIAKEAVKGYDLIVCPIAVKPEESSLSTAAVQKLTSRMSCSLLVVR